MQLPVYRDGALVFEDVPLERIAASAGTPCYVYSSQLIAANFRAYEDTLRSVPHSICYAVKANSNLSILRLLARAGAGFDIVSGGELYRVMQAGGDPSRVVFSGVGKSSAEIEYALRVGIHTFNCESEAELRLIDECARRHDQQARISVRVNPDVNPETHPYISTGLQEHKFGIAIDAAEPVYDLVRSLPNLTAVGVSCHIGSQILEPSPILEAVDRTLALVVRLRNAGHAISHIDLGGGLGVAYQPGQSTPSIAGFAAQLRDRIAGQNLKMMLEPGRSIVGEAGVLLTRVLFRKRTGAKDFVIVDAAMNDLMRPSLYQAYHEILPLNEPQAESITADIVGPVCETGDFFARGRSIPPVDAGDLLAICTAGAYGFVLASNYNSRPRPPEVLVEGASWRIVRPRETYEDLVKPERM